MDDKVNRSLRHIRSRFHRLREAIRVGYIRWAWVRKDEMLADVPTNCMHAPSFIPFRDKLVVATPVAPPVAAPVAAPGGTPVPAPAGATPMSSASP
jgi:hypothetical protein